MSTFAERLVYARKQLDISQADLARKTGVSQATIATAETAMDRRPRAALAIARALGVSPDWLIHGRGPMRESNIVLADLGSSRVPLLGSVPAGDWKASLDDSDHEIISTHLKLGRNAFATRIQGRSMEPEFKEGDVVIIDPNLALHPGDYVIAQNHSPRGEGATFKKYRPKGLMGGVEIFELIPLNPDFETLRSDEYQIEIIGVMVEHRRFRRV